MRHVSESWQQIEEIEAERTMTVVMGGHNPSARQISAVVPAGTTAMNSEESISAAAVESFRLCKCVQESGKIKKLVDKQLGRRSLPLKPPKRGQKATCTTQTLRT